MRMSRSTTFTHWGDLVSIVLSLLNRHNREAEMDRASLWPYDYAHFHLDPE